MMVRTSLVAGAIVLVFSSCGSKADRDATVVERDDGQEVVLLTMDEPQDGTGRARIEGVLGLNDAGCVSIDGVAAVFPFGAELSDDGRSVRVGDSDYRLDDTIVGSGGEYRQIDVPKSEACVEAQGPKSKMYAISPE